jgi:hypothetical protein
MGRVCEGLLQSIRKGSANLTEKWGKIQTGTSQKAIKTTINYYYILTRA